MNEPINPDAPEQLEQLAAQLTAKLTDEGKLIEAGWVGLHMATMKDASLEQLAHGRMIFFAGAHHLLASIMSVLEPGTEPTEKDYERMANIQRELDEYVKQLKRRFRLDG